MLGKPPSVPQFHFRNPRLLEFAVVSTIMFSLSSLYIPKFGMNSRISWQATMFATLEMVTDRDTDHFL